MVTVGLLAKPARIVTSVGPEYYFGMLSFVDKDQLEPACAILMHNKAMGVRRLDLVQPHHHNQNHSNHEFTCNGSSSSFRSFKLKEQSWPNSGFRRSRRLLWLFKWKESVVANQ